MIINYKLNKNMFLILAVCSILFFNPSVASAENNGTFYYFAYGSNLLAKRLHIQNPSAVFFSPAKLKNYRLDFQMYVESWNGAVATIAEDDDRDVWGSLWTLDIDQVQHLDEQEGVHHGWYFVKNVMVTTPDGAEYTARTYQEPVNPNKLAPGEDLPLERRPSNTYLMTIALGAIESKLPSDYIGFIFSIPSNGQMATEEKRKALGYPFTDK